MCLCMCCLEAGVFSLELLCTLLQLLQLLLLLHILRLWTGPLLRLLSLLLSSCVLRLVVRLAVFVGSCCCR